MPDAAGNFKGISVPELPWRRRPDAKPNVAASRPARPHHNYCALHDVIFTSDWGGRCLRCMEHAARTD